MGVIASELNDLERRACTAILKAASGDNDGIIPPQTWAEMQSLPQERMNAIIEAAMRVRTDQQDVREVRETLDEMIADGEVTTKIDPVTGETRYRLTRDVA